MVKMSEVYANSETIWKDILIRKLFDDVDRLRERIDNLEELISRMGDKSQPLNRIANSPKSWLPRMEGNDAG